MAFNPTMFAVTDLVAAKGGITSPQRQIFYGLLGGALGASPVGLGVTLALANREAQQTPSASRLTITTTALPNGTAGATYNTTLMASGGAGPYTWSVTSAQQLPPGLSLNAATGAISGTPTPTAAGGPYNITIQVTDSGGQSVSAGLSLSIASQLTITTAVLPNGTAGATYNTTLMASGGAGPYTWSVTSAQQLPPGLSLNAATGAISGTPAAAGGPYNITIQVADSAGQKASTTLSLTIASQLTITTTSLPNFTPNNVYTATLQPLGGTPPYTWSLVSGSLPLGLALTEAGVISGGPTVSGLYTITVEVADSSNQKVWASFDLSNVAQAAVVAARAARRARRKQPGNVAQAAVVAAGAARRAPRKQPGKP